MSARIPVPRKKAIKISLKNAENLLINVKKENINVDLPGFINIFLFKKNNEDIVRDYFL